MKKLSITCDHERCTGKVTTTSPMLQKTVTRPCTCTCHQEEDE